MFALAWSDCQSIQGVWSRIGAFRGRLAARRGAPVFHRVANTILWPDAAGTIGSGKAQWFSAWATTRIFPAATHFIGIRTATVTRLKIAFGGETDPRVTTGGRHALAAAQSQPRLALSPRPMPDR